MTIETNETGNRLLAAMNKWLIAHEDVQIEGVFCGLQGENVEVWSLDIRNLFTIRLAGLWIT